jgi:hypothetical protein
MGPPWVVGPPNVPAPVNAYPRAPATSMGVHSSGTSSTMTRTWQTHAAPWLPGRARWGASSTWARADRIVPILLAAESVFVSRIVKDQPEVI